MKNTPQRTILNDFIGGTLSHEIISLETDYPYYGEREEAYLTIPLDIKNKRNIYEALDFYVKEDILEGDNKYHCEQYERKIKVMKRCCIKTLPNTLIITLKRFDFDFASMQKVKINDYFEFPTTLNVKPWTKVGLKDQIPPEANYEPPNYDDTYYDYELVGVLVHSGTADAGHYYSFIKDRNNSKKGWFEFNDNRVKPFDIKNLKNECFGSDSVDSKSIYDFEFTKTRSAYILFYERNTPQNNETYSKYKDKGVPLNLCESIWRDNLELLRSKYFYDVDYFKFVMELFKLYKFPTIYMIPESYSEPPEMNKLRKKAEVTKEEIKAIKQFESTGEIAEKTEMIEESPDEDLSSKESDEDQYGDHTKTLRLALVLASGIYMKNRDSDQFEKWMHLLQKALETFLPGNIWLLKFLTQNPEFLKLIYEDKISSTVKEAIRDLLVKAISKTFQIESPFFMQEEEFQILNQSKLEIKTVKKSSLARFLKVLIQSFFKGKKDLSKPIEYFDFMNILAKMNMKIANFLIYEGLLNDTFDLFVQAKKSSGGAFSLSSGAKDKDKYHTSNVESMFRLVESLVRSCITEHMYTNKSLPPSFLFSENDVDWDTCPKVPEQMTEKMLEVDHFNKFFIPMQDKSGGFVFLLQHLAWENKEVSKKLVQQLTSQICSFMINSRNAEEQIKMVYHLVVMNDSLQPFRIECMFGEIPNKTILSSSLTKGTDLVTWMMKARETHDKVPCIIVIRWLGMLVQEAPAFKDYIIQNIGKFEWIPYFLDDNIHAKQNFYTIIDSELNVKVPQYLKKSFEIFTEILPYNPKPRVEAVAVEVIEEESADKEKDTKNQGGLFKLKGWDREFDFNQNKNNDSRNN